MTLSLRVNTLVLLMSTGCAITISPSAEAPTPDAATPPAGRCVIGDPARARDVVLAVALGPALHLVRTDRSSFAAYTFGSARNAAPESVHVYELVARGDFIAASARTNDSRWGEVVLLNRAGRVLWRRERDFTQTPGASNQFTALRLNVAGTLAVGGADASGNGALVRADGSMTSLTGWVPLSELSPEGVLLAQSRAGGVVWLDVASGAQTPLPYRRTNDYTAPRWAAGRAIYQGVRDGASVLVSATPREARTIDIPPEAPERVALRNVDRQGRVVFGVPFGDAVRIRLWRGDFATGQRTPLALTLPAGQQLFRASAGEFVPGFDEEGELLLGLRGPSSGALYRSPDFGAHWARVGAPVRDVLAVVGSTHGGTAIVRGSQSPPMASFVRMPESWSPAASGEAPPVGPQTVQFARLDGSLQGPLAEGANVMTALSDDGRCVLFWQTATALTSGFFVRDLDAPSEVPLAIDELPHRTGTYLSRSATWFP